MNAVRVPWSSASVLVYLGGITILFATVTLLTFEAENHGSAGLVIWAFLVFVAISAAAFMVRALGHFVTAGLLATSCVVAFLVFLGSILEWFGWLPDLDEGGVFEGFRFWLLVLELAAIIASAVALRIFEFPLLVLLLAASSWFFVTDLISGGGSWSAIVTIAAGIVFLLAGVAVDDGPSRPFGFWLHVAAGLTIGGGLLWFFHDGLFDWIVIGVVGAVYILLGDQLLRSSWVVLGGWGMLQTATYFVDKWSDIQTFFPLLFLSPFLLSLEGVGAENEHDWLGPMIYALTGLVFICIGLWLARRRREPIAGAELL